MQTIVKFAIFGIAALALGGVAYAQSHKTDSQRDQDRADAHDRAGDKARDAGQNDDAVKEYSDRDKATWDAVDKETSDLPGAAKTDEPDS